MSRIKCATSDTLGVAPLPGHPLRLALIPAVGSLIYQGTACSTDYRVRSRFERNTCACHMSLCNALKRGRAGSTKLGNKRAMMCDACDMPSSSTSPSSRNVAGVRMEITCNAAAWIANRGIGSRRQQRTTFDRRGLITRQHDGKEN